MFFWVFFLFGEIGRLLDPKSEIGHSNEVQFQTEEMSDFKNGKKRRGKRAPLKTNNPEKDIIRGTLVRLPWLAAAPGLKPVRLPCAVRPSSSPWVNKTKQHTRTFGYTSGKSRDASHPVKLGRAASGGALAPEPPRATRSQPEPIRTVILWETHFLFKFFGLSSANF